MSRSDKLGPVVTEYLRSERPNIDIADSLLYLRLWTMEWKNLCKLGSIAQTESLLEKLIGSKARY